MRSDIAVASAVIFSPANWFLPCAIELLFEAFSAQIEITSNKPFDELAHYFVSQFSVLHVVTAKGTRMSKPIKSAWLWCILSSYKFYCLRGLFLCTNKQACAIHFQDVNTFEWLQRKLHKLSWLAAMSEAVNCAWTIGRLQTSSVKTATILDISL